MLKFGSAKRPAAQQNVAVKKTPSTTVRTT